MPSRSAFSQGQGTKGNKVRMPGARLRVTGSLMAESGSRMGRWYRNLEHPKRYLGLNVRPYPKLTAQGMGFLQQPHTRPSSNSTPPQARQAYIGQQGIPRAVSERSRLRVASRESPRNRRMTGHYTYLAIQAIGHCHLCTASQAPLKLKAGQTN